MSSSFEIHVSRRDVTPYDESGEWMDGDTRELWDYGTTIDVWSDDAYDGLDGPVAWAINRLRRLESFESSMHPIPDHVREHDWLLGYYCHPYDETHTETTAHLYGAWTPEQRAEVFRGVTA